MMYKRLIIASLCIVLLTSCTQAGSNGISDSNTIPEDYGGKTVINLSALSYDYELRKYVEAFNNQSDEYVVVVKSYVNLDELEPGLISYDSERTLFNTELMAGYIPDIVLCDIQMPIQRYVNNGLFTDLYALMDADPGFDKDDYLTNAFTASEQNGKLYEIFPAFSVQTLYAKTSDVGGMQEWTLDEFTSFLASKPNASYPVGSYSRQGFVVTMVPRLFIDDETSDVCFNRAEFLKLLEAAQRFPEQSPQVIDFATLNVEMSGGDPIMCVGILSSPRDIRVWEQAFAREDITLIGFPRSASGESTPGSSYFFPSLTLAITEQSEEKDGAWEFIKFVLDSGLGGPIPIKRSLIDDLMDEAKRDFYGSEYVLQVILEYAQQSDDIVSVMVDEYGNITEGRGVPIVMEIPVGNNTDEDNAKFIAFLQSVSNVLRYDAAVTSIVGEEVDAYFSGQCTAEQAADVIESKLEIYYAEFS